MICAFEMVSFTLSFLAIRVKTVVTFTNLQALEYTVHHAPASQFDSLSPFLVPVTSTVCLHLRTVKLLVATQRSVIIIPQQVIQVSVCISQLFIKGLKSAKFEESYSLSASLGSGQIKEVQGEPLRSRGYQVL